MKFKFFLLVFLLLNGEFDCYATNLPNQQSIDNYSTFLALLCQNDESQCVETHTELQDLELVVNCLANTNPICQNIAQAPSNSYNDQSLQPQTSEQEIYRTSSVPNQQDVTTDSNSLHITYSHPHYMHYPHNTSGGQSTRFIPPNYPTDLQEQLQLQAPARNSSGFDVDVETTAKKRRTESQTCFTRENVDHSGNQLIPLNSNELTPLVSTSQTRCPNLEENIFDECLALTEHHSDFSNDPNFLVMYEFLSENTDTILEGILPSTFEEGLHRTEDSTTFPALATTSELSATTSEFRDCETEDILKPTSNLYQQLLSSKSGHTCFVLEKFKDVIETLEAEFEAFNNIRGLKYSALDVLYSNDFKNLTQFKDKIFYFYMIKNTERVKAMSTTADCLIEFLKKLRFERESSLVENLFKAFNIDPCNISNTNLYEKHVVELDLKAKDEVYSFLISDESCLFKSLNPGLYSFISRIEDLDLIWKGDFTRCFLCFLIMLKKSYMIFPDIRKSFKLATLAEQKNLIIRTTIENQIPLFYVFLSFLNLIYVNTKFISNLKGVFWFIIYKTDNDIKSTEYESLDFFILNLLFYYFNEDLFKFKLQLDAQKGYIAEEMENKIYEILENNIKRVICRHQGEISKQIISLKRVFDVI